MRRGRQSEKYCKLRDRKCDTRTVVTAATSGQQEVAFALVALYNSAASAKLESVLALNQKQLLD